MLVKPIEPLLHCFAEELSRLIELKVISSEHLETTKRNKLNDAHSLILGALANAAYKNIGEEYNIVALGHGLKAGDRRFVPDISLWLGRKETKLIGVMDYESTNSSDERISERNFDNYSKYVTSGKPSHGIPQFWIIVSTLPNKKVERRDWSSWDYKKSELEYGKLQKNPFEYLSRIYEKKFKDLLSAQEECPLYVANLDFKELKVYLPKDVSWAHSL